MNKEPKTWVVFGTKMGYVVSTKKMTAIEAKVLQYNSRIEHDYQKEMGFWGYEFFITSIEWLPTWTKKDAQRYCDKLNKGNSNMIYGMLDVDNYEVEE